MDDKREWRSETGGGRQKRSRAEKSTAYVTHDLRGDCENGHTMGDMRYLYCNDNPKDLKRNRKSRGGKSGRLSWIHVGDA